MLQRRSVAVRRPDCPRRAKPCLLGTVAAGVWMDNQELQRLAMGTPEADLTVALGGRPVASTLGAVLARLLSRPLGELAEQARAIARGDFARPPSAVRAGGEVSELARAFERMRVELGHHLAALRSSRDELARSMNRLGETLSSTHDLPKLLRSCWRRPSSPAAPAPAACC
jgi:HAMP domain-containing protein